MKPLSQQTMNTGSMDTIDNNFSKTVKLSLLDNTSFTSSQCSSPFSRALNPFHSSKILYVSAVWENVWFTDTGLLFIFLLSQTYHYQKFQSFSVHFVSVGKIFLGWGEFMFISVIVRWFCIIFIYQSFLY